MDGHRAALRACRCAGASSVVLDCQRGCQPPRVADALDDGAISAHRLSGLRWSPKATRSAVAEPARALTRAELALLLEHVCPDRRLMVAFMAATGCRVSETLGLDWPDLDLGDRPQMRVGAQRYRSPDRAALKSSFAQARSR